MGGIEKHNLLSGWYMVYSRTHIQKLSVSNDKLLNSHYLSQYISHKQFWKILHFTQKSSLLINFHILTTNQPIL